MKKVAINRSLLDFYKSGKSDFDKHITGDRVKLDVFRYLENAFDVCVDDAKEIWTKTIYDSRYGPNMQFLWEIKAAPKDTPLAIQELSINREKYGFDTRNMPYQHYYFAIKYGEFVYSTNLKVVVRHASDEFPCLQDKGEYESVGISLMRFWDESGPMDTQSVADWQAQIKSTKSVALVFPDDLRVVLDKEVVDTVLFLAKKQKAKTIEVGLGVNPINQRRTVMVKVGIYEVVLMMSDKK